MIAATREMGAVLAALAVYRLRIVPAARDELARWRAVAADLADPGARAAALASIDEKGLNVEATAVFAILAPRRARPAATRAMVALQVAIDYLDTLGEQPSDDPLGEGLRQHAALTADRNEGDEPSTPGFADPYLDRLVAAYRAALAALPSHGSLAAALERAVSRCGEGQAYTHAAEHGDTAGLEAWARAQEAPAGYRWWEVAAGASSSVAAHALIALAATPGASASEAALVDTAYSPPVGALTVLLDDLIDRDEDAARGAHNYLSYYRDGEETAGRLESIARGARVALESLRWQHRHTAILTGVLGFYLSDAATESPGAAPIRARLLAAAGPGVRPIAAVMRRARKRPEGAGSVFGP